jgi:HK97 family phage major capsid protein
MSHMKMPSQNAAIELKSADDDANAIVTKALGDFTTNVNDRLARIEEKAAAASILTDRLDKMETRINRVNIVGNARNEGERSIERKAFESYARRGVERMAADEAKSLSVATNSAGGFLAPPEFGTELITLLRQFSPIRQYAKVVTIGALDVVYPRRTASTAATWVGETATRATSDMAFDQLTLTPYELATFTDVSNQLLEDNAYNLEGELAADLAESFGIAEGLAFVKGTGGAKPNGVMGNSSIASIITGNATGFPTSNPTDILMSLFHALPGVHAQNAVWMMNRTSLGVIRKFKDGEGRYIIVDPLSAGAPATLLGRPIVEAVDMDDIGAGNNPVLFGDLQGYRIVDRVGLSILRDPFTLATTGQVRFHARKRVGGDVTNPDRFVKLTVSAT